MSIITSLRAGVKTINNVTRTGGLQTLVTYERFTNADGYGNPTYAAATTLHALVDWRSKQVRTQTGELSVSRIQIMLVDVAEILSKTGGQGIGDFDKFTLPDGSTGPILDISGYYDPLTNDPIATEVLLG